MGTLARIGLIYISAVFVNTSNLAFFFLVKIRIGIFIFQRIIETEDVPQTILKISFISFNKWNVSRYLTC